MTHNASPTRYPSKKAFIAAVAADPTRVYLEDASIFSPVAGSINEIFLNNGGAPIYVTNHPRRSWFAQVKLDKNNKMKAV